jgi:hypothetical protein
VVRFRQIILESVADFFPGGEGGNAEVR